MRLILITVGAAGALALAGCGTTDEQRAATGALGGAVVAGPVGAVAGAAAGAALDEGVVDKAEEAVE